MSKLYIKNKGKAYNRISLITLFLNEKPATYSDEACTIVQCEAKRFRSVTEILQIVQTYYPNTSLTDVLSIIKKLIDKDSKIALIWCTQVNKVVLKYLNDSNTIAKQYITTYSKSNHQNKKGVDGFSLADYEKILNKL